MHGGSGDPGKHEAALPFTVAKNLGLKSCATTMPFTEPLSFMQVRLHESRKRSPRHAWRTEEYWSTPVLPRSSTRQAHRREPSHLWLGAGIASLHS